MHSSKWTLNITFLSLWLLLILNGPTSKFSELHWDSYGAKPFNDLDPSRILFFPSWKTMQLLVEHSLHIKLFILNRSTYSCENDVASGSVCIALVMRVLEPMQPWRWRERSASLNSVFRERYQNQQVLDRLCSVLVFFFFFGKFFYGHGFEPVSSVLCTGVACFSSPGCHPRLLNMSAQTGKWEHVCVWCQK